MLEKIHKKRLSRLIAYLNFVALVVLAIIVFYDYSSQGLTYWLSKNNLYEVKDYFNSLSLSMSLFASSLLVLIEVVIGVIPAIIMYPILGFVLGTEKALIVIFSMGLLGNLINYYQGKILVDAFVDKAKNSKILDKLEYGGGLALFLIRLNPLTSVDSVSYFAGAINMRITTFILATGLGTLPFIFLSTIFGVEVLNILRPYLEVLIYITLAVIALKIVKAKKKSKKLKSLGTK